MNGMTISDEYIQKQHVQMISNQFNSDTNNFDIDYTQYNKIRDRVFQTINKSTKHKLQQYYNDIPIFGATLVVEYINNEIRPIFGKYYNKEIISHDIGNNDIPIIDKETVIQLITNKLDISVNDIDYIQRDLYIYHYHNIFHLVWIIYLGFNGNNQEILTIVNAKNGDFLRFKYIYLGVTNKINVCGDGGNTRIGKYTYCDYQSLQIDEIPYLSNQYFTLFNDANNGEIFECEESSDICYIKDEVNDAYCMACDIYYHLTVSFEMYLDWMGILPLRDNRYPIYVYLHDENTQTAKYSYKGNKSMMIFGDGDQLYTFPWISLDIVGIFFFVSFSTEKREHIQKQKY